MELKDNTSMDERSKYLDSNKLLKAEEAAHYLGVTEGTLDVWRSTKRYNLKYIKVGRLVRYRLSDLEDFLLDRTISMIDKL